MDRLIILRNACPASRTTVPTESCIYALPHFLQRLASPSFSFLPVALSVHLARIEYLLLEDVNALPAADVVCDLGSVRLVVPVQW